MARLGRLLGHSTSFACGKARKAVINSLLEQYISLAGSKAGKVAWTFYQLGLG